MISMKKTRMAALAGLISVVGFMAMPAAAGTLTSFGTAILQAGNGSVVVSGNGSTGGCIIWYNGGSPPTTCPTTGTGNLTVQGGSTAPFTVGDMGTIDNLNFNTTLPLVGFMVINNGTNNPNTIDFDLNDIRFNGSTAIGSCSGSSELTPGASCTPANSPFTITNGLGDPANNNMVDSATVTLTVDAFGYTGGSGMNYNSATPYVGTISTQQAIRNATIQSILNSIQGGGSVSASWSATFQPSSTVPEPAPFLLLASGLMAIGLARKRGRNA